MSDDGAQNGHPRLLGIFAHPDDETFSAGGTLAKYAAGGAEAMVVSFTRGEAGQIRNAREATRRTLGQVRELELRDACLKLGVRNVTCLDYPDGALAELASSTIVGEIVGLIRSFRPDIVFTMGDEGELAHPDHSAVSEAVIVACRAAGNGKQYKNQLKGDVKAHAPERLYRSVFPRNRLLLMDHLVKWLQERKNRFRGSTDYVNGLTLFASESSSLGYHSDDLEVGWYPPGFYVVEQGEPATSLFLILSGKAEVVREDADGGTRAVSEIGPGEFFGEEGLATGNPRNASVIALESVTCLVLSPRDYEDQAEPELQGISATTEIDVSDFVTQKMAAIASHRSQYPVSIDMFPHDTMVEMLGREYFVKVVPNGSMETDLST